MDRKKANELISRIEMEFELAPLLGSDGSYERFEKTIIDLLKRDPPGSVKGCGRNRFRMEYRQNKGKNTPRKGVEAYRYPRVIEEFKEFYGIGNLPKRVSLMSKERNLSEQAIRNDIELVEKILADKYKQDIWYGTL